MNSIFIQLLNMSITAGWIVLAVIILRVLLKKAPKWIMGILWGFVGLRLIFPFSIHSVFSLIPSSETISQNIGTTASPAIDSGLPFVNRVVNPIISDTLTPNPAESANPLQIITTIAAFLWLTGVTAMLIYSVVSYIRIYRKVSESVKSETGAYICDKISTPFIFGIFRPKIYLPSAMNQADTEYVLLHENAHLKRRDYIRKPISFLLLTVYWFNPLLWVAYILMCRDIELACDEKVLKDNGARIKKNYSDALINCSVPRKTVAVCPLAFGEVGVKSRVKSVLNYKKPTFWIVIVAIIACIVAAVCLLTNPLSTKIDDQLKVFLDAKIVEQHQSSKTDDNFVTVDYKILGTKKNSSETTVYAWVLYEEYSYNGELKVESGSHIPTAITVRKTKNSGDSGIDYELVEYWIPRDGSYYADDIKDKFPLSLRSKALNNDCIDEQKSNCLKSAQEYYGLSVSTVGGVDEPNTILEKGSEITGISLDFVSAEFSGDSPLIKIRWNNSSNQELAFGAQFYIYRKDNGEWVDCRDTSGGEYSWISIVYGLPAGTSDTHSYSVSDIDMSKPGVYRFESIAFGKKVWCDFEIKDNSADSSSHESTAVGENPYFNATVLEVYDKSFLVKPDENSAEIKSADKISVSLDVISTDSVPELQKGSNIRIVYNGEIADSYPAQIIKVFAIYSLD